MKKIFLSLSLMLILASCSLFPSSDNPTENPQSGSKTGVSTNSTLNDLKGFPSAILFGGTFCPHCRDAMPDFETKVFTPYKNKANVWVNVIDGEDGKKFDNDVIDQGFNKNLKYNDITGDECKYVPSWVVLDKNGEVAMKSCGNEKTIDEMAEKIKELTL